MNDPDLTRISARVPTELVRELEQKAHEEDRSFSAELRRAIRAYLASADKEDDAA